jgi:hypothetical protein
MVAWCDSVAHRLRIAAVDERPLIEVQRDRHDGGRRRWLGVQREPHVALGAERAASAGSRRVGQGGDRALSGATHPGRPRQPSRRWATSRFVAGPAGSTRNSRPYARHFTLADRFFANVLGRSFPGVSLRARRAGGLGERQPGHQLRPPGLGMRSGRQRAGDRRGSPRARRRRCSRASTSRAGRRSARDGSRPRFDVEVERRRVHHMRPPKRPARNHRLLAGVVAARGDLDRGPG